MDLVDFLNTPHLIIILFLFPFQGHGVREPGQLFEYSSSDYPTHLLSSSVSRMYAKLYHFFLLNTPHLIPLSSSVCSQYVNFVNCLNHLTILFHPIPSRLYVNVVNSLNIRNLNLIIPSILSRLYVNLVNCLNTFDYSISSLSSVSRLYVNLVNCFKASNLILFHPFHLSPDST